MEYARSHGLTREYMDEDPLLSHLIPQISDSLNSDLEDPPDAHSLFHFSSLAVKEVVNSERWIIDRGTADFLSSVIALPAEYAAPSGNPWKKLKLDPPLMISDPGAEMQRLYRRNTVFLTSNDLPRFPVKTDADESFEWSASVGKLAVKFEHEIQVARLEIGQDTIQYLQQTVRPPHEELSAAIDSIEPWYRPPLSPPLLPMSPPLEIEDIPIVTTAELPFTSTPDDLMAGEAQLVERNLLEADDVAASQPGRDLGTAMDYVPRTPSPLSKWRTGFSTPFLHGQLVRHTKVDVPLTPQAMKSTPEFLSVAANLPNDVRHLVPELTFEQSDIDQSMVDAEFSTLFADFVEPFAASVEQLAMNEPLVEVDTTMRVKVPALDKLPLHPPWVGDTGDLMKRNSRELLKNEAHWAGLSKLEQSLTWRPFPAYLAKVSLEEDFDDGSLARYLRELNLEGAVDTNLTAQRAGLLLVQEQENDNDELEDYSTVENPLSTHANDPVVPHKVLDGYSRVEHPVPPDMGWRVCARLDVPPKVVPQKRKHMLGSWPVNRTGLANSELDDLVKKKKRKIEDSTNAQVLSTGNLNTFMRLQGQEYDSDQARRDLPNAQEEQAKAATVPDVRPPQTAQAAPPAHLLTSLPVPTPEEDQTRGHQVVLASTLLANRPFTRRIQQLLPNLDLIERDRLTLTKEASQKQPRATPPPTEADLVLSPGTGLMVTTLQKLKQKALPGQSGHFGLRERIAAVALRHERLSILVSEGRTGVKDDAGAEQPLDERDCDALADLNGFIAMLDCEIQMHYLAGGESELAHWVAALIQRHANASSDAKLLHDETLWERFLRTAGMDAFAAQIVLANVKTPSGESVDGDVHRGGSSSELGKASEGAYGLAAFVEMGLVERLRRFGPVLGGEAELRRVSEVVDGGWLSAASMR